MNFKYYNEIIDKIVALKQQGVGSRQIAKQLNIGKSTVNQYYKYYLESNNIINDDVKDSSNVLKKGPRILIFDIEYAPSKVMVYGRYKQFIVQDFVLEEGYMLSFSAKWLGEDNVVAYNLPMYETYTGPWCRNDKKLVEDLHKLLDEADFVVAHNLIGYDWKMANTRFVYHGLTPISPTKLVDTLVIAKKNFRFPDNKLNTIANYFGLGSKTENSGASMWREVMEGKQEAWEHELEYNIQDVYLLEQVYLKLRAFDNRHPSVAPYYKDNEMHCICCGSTDLDETDKFSYTSLSQFKVYKCNDCHKINRGRINLRTKQQMSNTVMNIG